mgnify:CR=1 FL=1
MSTNSPTRPNVFQFFLNLELPQKIALLVLSIVSLQLITLGGLYLFSRNRVQKLVIGAGLEQGESYILAQALKQVLDKQQIGIELEVRDTGGTSESLKLLEQNQVQLAAAQADIPPGDNARLVAILFPDAFQLVVKENSQIQKFTDLKGKRIGLLQKGGQYQSLKSGQVVAD